MFRYRLPYIKGSKITKKSISGIVIYTYKWFYTVEDLDLADCIKEEASNLREFKKKDKLKNSKKLNKLKTTAPSKIVKKDKEVVIVAYSFMNKQERYNVLIQKDFSKEELIGKTSNQLLELLELEEGLD